MSYTEDDLRAALLVLERRAPEPAVVAGRAALDPVRSRTKRVDRVPVLMAAVLVVVAAVVVAAVTRTRSPSEPAAATGEPATAWSDYAVDVTPRPVVLFANSNSIDAPVEVAPGRVDAWPSVDAENAYRLGKVRIGGALASGPAKRNGYALLSVAAAVARVAEPQPNASARPTKTYLEVSSARLVEHTFFTDRGAVPLPTWQLHIGGASTALFVLAIAGAGLDNHKIAQGNSARDAAATEDGHALTFPFEAHHPATGVCDPETVSTLSVTQLHAVVVIDITTVPVGGNNAAISCPPIGAPNQLLVPGRPLTPGRPGTRTVHLDAPLGARVLVDETDQLYQVSGTTTATNSAPGSLTWILAGMTAPLAAILALSGWVRRRNKRGAALGHDAPAT